MNGEYVKCKCGVLFSPFHFAGPDGRAVMHDCPVCDTMVHFIVGKIKTKTPAQEKKLRASGKWVESQDEINTRERRAHTEKKYQEYLKMTPAQKKKLSPMDLFSINMHKVFRKD